jgi:hypothetical protein
MKKTNQISKIKISYKGLVNNDPRFLDCFDKLSAETNLPTKDKYSLARTRRDIVSALEDYEKLRVGLVKKFGKPEADIREAQLGKLPKDSDKALVKALTDRIATAKQQDSYMIDPEDTGANEKFRNEINDLLAIEFDVFLDHKITLPENCALSGAEMSSLLDIVTV